MGSVLQRVVFCKIQAIHKQEGCTRLIPPTIRVLPEFAWLGEKTTGLARASCSTKEHIEDPSSPPEADRDLRNVRKMTNLL